MPPRKSLRLATGTATDAPADLTAAQPRSAAREAWALSEIRSAVFRELDKPDLARCLRVEKGAMKDVARELYYSVEYKFARKMGAATARQRMYCQSVHTINCRDMVLTQSVFREVDAAIPPLPHCRSTAERAEHLTKFYSVPLIEIVVPPLRKKFIHARKILFGDEYATTRGDSWVIHCHPQSGQSTAGIGHIALAVGHRFYGWGKIDPPADIKPTPPAPEGYTLRRRFDMDITSMKDAAVDQWLAAFKEKPYFSELSTSISLSRFPYHLDDLVGLCNRQGESGDGRGLLRVEAEDILPFNLYDLQTFTAAASASLTQLVLLPSGFRVDHLALSFDDLPELMSTISSGFPHLQKLDIALKGVETAEETVLPLLADNALEPGGSIMQLYIATAETSNPLFNLIRCLSRMCSSKASLNIGYDPMQHARKRSQTACLQYLRRQSASRRSHLSTIDFTSLNISTLDEILALQYHDDGRPRGLAESKALGVVEILKAAGPPVAEKYRGWLDAILEQCEQSSRLMEMVSTSTDTADRLLAAEKALQAVHCVRGLGMLLQDLFSEGNEEEIKKYIESLKRDVEGA